MPPGDTLITGEKTRTVRGAVPATGIKTAPAGEEAQGAGRTRARTLRSRLRQEVQRALREHTAPCALAAAGVIFGVIGLSFWVSSAVARHETATLEARKATVEADLVRLRDTTLSSALHVADIDTFAALLVDAGLESAVARQGLEDTFAFAVEALDSGDRPAAEGIIEKDAAPLLIQERQAYEQFAETLSRLREATDD